MTFPKDPIVYSESQIIKQDTNEEIVVKAPQTMPYQPQKKFDEFLSSKKNDYNEEEESETSGEDLFNLSASSKTGKKTLSSQTKELSSSLEELKSVLEKGFLKPKTDTQQDTSQDSSIFLPSQTPFLSKETSSKETTPSTTPFSIFSPPQNTRKSAKETTIESETTSTKTFFSETRQTLTPNIIETKVTDFSTSENSPKQPLKTEKQVIKTLFKEPSFSSITETNEVYTKDLSYDENTPIRPSETTISSSLRKEPLQKSFLDSNFIQENTTLSIPESSEANTIDLPTRDNSTKQHLENKISKEESFLQPTQVEEAVDLFTRDNSPKQRLQNKISKEESFLQPIQNQETNEIKGTARSEFSFMKAPLDQEPQNLNTLKGVPSHPFSSNKNLTSDPKSELFNPPQRDDAPFRRAFKDNSPLQPSRFLSEEIIQVQQGNQKPTSLPQIQPSIVQAQDIQPRIGSNSQQPLQSNLTPMSIPSSTPPSTQDRWVKLPNSEPRITIPTNFPEKISNRILQDINPTRTSFVEQKKDDDIDEEIIPNLLNIYLGNPSQNPSSLQNSQDDVDTIIKTPLSIKGFTDTTSSKEERKFQERKMLQEALSTQGLSDAQVLSLQQDLSTAPSPTPLALTKEETLSLIEKIVDHIQLVESRDKTETVLTLKHPPTFEGATIRISEFTLAQKEYNLYFSNLSDEAKKILDDKNTLQTLSKMFDERGLVIHIVQTTQRNDEFMASFGEFERNQRNQQEQQEKENEEERRRQEEIVTFDELV